MKLREGDKVKVMTGKDAGRESRIVRVFPKTGKIIVEGINTAKRHQRARGQTMQAGIVDKDMPLDASNVMLVCDDCGPTRVGAAFKGDGTKYRRCVKCGGEV